MRKLALLFLLFCPCLAHAGGDWAVLRITSHGCSGTVIYADDKKSLVLTCAHMFLAPPRYQGEPDHIDPNALAKSFTFDAPHPNPGANPKPGIRLLKYDVSVDLALIQVNTRLPYVCPVCPVGMPNKGAAASVGYDFMQWPAVVRPAQILRQDSVRQYTMQRPRPGRSGGPLLGCNGTCVVGVCTGYTGPNNNLETVQGGEGIYSSQTAIWKFLEDVRVPSRLAVPGMGPMPLLPHVMPTTPKIVTPANPFPTRPPTVASPAQVPGRPWVSESTRRLTPQEMGYIPPRPGTPYAAQGPGCFCAPGCPCGPNCPCPPGFCPQYCPGGVCRPGGT